MPDYPGKYLKALTPLDGRYGPRLEKLAEHFSELALIKARTHIEVEYLIALSQLDSLPECPPIGDKEVSALRKWVNNFSVKDGQKVKETEGQLNHDVKSVEVVLAQHLDEMGLGQYRPWVHFALTSEDVNNLAYTLNFKSALESGWKPALYNFENLLTSLAHEYAGIPMLGMTHGQPATPTTVGKELAVFVARLRRQIKALDNHRFTGKFSGATGTWAAHQAAVPKVDWKAFSRTFVESLGLEFNAYTTQIESGDALAESLHILMRVHSILIDFSRDMWLYISRGIISQKRTDAEVGSSTMPHKINPIYFENAEGNFGLGSALFSFLAENLTKSRMQRDLSGSTIIRNLSTALGYSYLGVSSLISGLKRAAVNEDTCRRELNDHWEVLAEAVQTVLRKQGLADAYDRLKAFSRGKVLDRESLQKFIETLPLPENEKERLLNLTPEQYIGLAKQLAENI